MGTMTGMNHKLEFKGKYFDNNKDAKHVLDEDVQRMIDNVTECLINSKYSNDWAYNATGDTMVFGFRYMDDNEISIYVTQKYNQAILCTEDKGKTWMPIDWSVTEFDGESTIEELYDRIRRIEGEIRDVKNELQAQYNPRREY